MDEIIKYFGVGLLTTTVLVSGYTLLFRITDTKRLITFAAIGFFSGTLLILCERTTVIRMPVLGEIVAKAREDAMEISDIRKEVEKQRVQVTRVVEQATQLDGEMAQLSKRLDAETSSAKKERLLDRKKILIAKIEELEEELETERLPLLKKSSSAHGREIFDLMRKQAKNDQDLLKYQYELHNLEKELKFLDPSPQKPLEKE